MVTDFRNVLDAIAIRTGLWNRGEIRSKMFRHTYASTRLETLDSGKPISVFTVSRELGHASTTLVEKTYGHVGGTRHRSEVVEYLITQHEGKLAPYLRLLKSA